MYRWVLLIALSWTGCQTEPTTIRQPPPPAPAGSFTIAVLPDTQHYSHVVDWNVIFETQTQWLAEYRDHLAIEMVVHLGDLVEASWLDIEWEVASRAMGWLDGEVPYIIAAGNHDYGATYEERNAGTRSTLLDTYFPRERFTAMPTFGGLYPDGDRTDNGYQVFTASGVQWLVLALEFGPRDEVLAWANEVLDQHPEHRVIIATHAYLYFDDTRYDWATHNDVQAWNPNAYGIGKSPEETVNDGQAIWDQLIADRDNVVAVLCGHVLNDGLGYAVSRGAGEVHEILSNYQVGDFGGAGYLRLMHFHASGQVEVTTYSPWLDQYLTDPVNAFTFDISSHLPGHPIARP